MIIKIYSNIRYKLVTKIFNTIDNRVYIIKDKTLFDIVYNKVSHLKFHIRQEFKKYEI